MFSLPSQNNRRSPKNSDKHFFLNSIQLKAKPNIKQIKQQIQLILKRNNSPVSFYPPKHIKEGAKHITNYSLERKTSRVIHKSNQQNVQKALNNRKTYQQFLLSDIASKSHYKSTNQPKQTHQTLNIKQAEPLSHGIQAKQQLSAQKKALSSCKIGQNERNTLTEKQNHRLRLGKLLFYKDSQIKLRRKDLLSGRTSADKIKLFKQRPPKSSYQQTHIDFTKHLKSTSSTKFQNQQNKEREHDQTFTSKSSLQILKKEIIPKNQSNLTYITTINLEDLKMISNLKDYRSSTQRLRQKVRKYDLSPDFEYYQKEKTPHQTLNVFDQQLLVYYGKLKNRKFEQQPTGNYKDSHRFLFKNKFYPQKTFSLTASNDQRHSFEHAIVPSTDKNQKFHHFDPWEKFKFDDQLGHLNLFPRLSSKMDSEGQQSLNK